MHKKKMISKFVGSFFLGVLALTLAFVAVFTVRAHAQPAVVFTGGKPLFVTIHHNQQKIAAALAASKPGTAAGQVNTIPYWSDLFVSGGLPYPYQMVGTNPVLGSQQTTVTTEIIPLKLIFSDGSVLDGTSKVTSTVHSPLFQTATYSSGSTQYVDAIQRAEFWKYVQNGGTNYHVLLGTPTVYSTVTLKVPAASGSISRASTGTLVGKTDINYFDAQLQNLLTTLKISPNTFPIFLTNNDFQYENGDPTQCCVLGYHSAIFGTTSSGQSQIQTYAWGSFLSSGLFGTQPIRDINGLSHEFAEWANDPFLDNMTPTWSSPISPQYGCNNYLEVGDPLVGVAFSVTTGGMTYHPQDEAFFSWFAKQKPSLGINGRYTYLGTFSSPTPTC